MADAGSMLRERAAGFEPPPTGIADLRRRRDRRESRRRGTALVVGIAVGVAAVVAGVRVSTLQPGVARPPVITPANVSTLELAWQLERRDVVGVGIGERYVFLATREGALRALEPQTGQVAWSADPGVPTAVPPATGEGLVAVQGTDGVLRLFRETCSSGACTPEWTARTGASATRPVIGDGVVAVASEDGRLSVFPLVCSNPCRPSWVAEVGGLDA